MFSVPTVMRGSFLSWSASVCSVCACTGLPSIRNPTGKPPAGGFSVTVSPSRCSTPRCAGLEWLEAGDTSLGRAKGSVTRLQPFESGERQPAVRLLQFDGMLCPPCGDFLLPARVLRVYSARDKNRQDQ